MDKDFGSRFLHQPSIRVSPNLNTLTVPFNPGQQHSVPAYMGHYANVGSTNGVFPWFPFSGFSHSKATQLFEPHGWFDFSPRVRQAFTPPPNTTLKEKVPAGPDEKRVEAIQRDSKASGNDQRRFLVFDKSGDQTFIFSSGCGTPAQCPTFLGAKPNNTYDSHLSQLGTGKDTIRCTGPMLTDECNENQRDDSESEMHEDTEELNALLYSDEDYYYNEEDEEASTGHSPSTMKGNDKRELSEESEEVASCGGPTKRMKTSDGGHGFPSGVDTACSFKPKRCFDYEDDAESIWAGGKNLGLGEKPVPAIGNKRSRKYKIRESVRIIRDIIPGGKGNDVAAILDEAISYLRTLKHKGLALGIDETL